MNARQLNAFSEVKMSVGDEQSVIYGGKSAVPGLGMRFVKLQLPYVVRTSPANPGEASVVFSAFPTENEARTAAQNYLLRNFGVQEVRTRASGLNFLAQAKPAPDSRFGKGLLSVDITSLLPGIVDSKEDPGIALSNGSYQNRMVARGYVFYMK